MPDGISAAVINGETYLLTANEGDSRAWQAEQRLLRKPATEAVCTYTSRCCSSVAAHLSV